MIILADSWDSMEPCLSLAHEEKDVFCALGIQPEHADTWGQGSVEKLRSYLKRERVVAVGEIGLDFHYEQVSREIQKETFHAQLLLAKELTLPVVIHSREAIDDIWNIVDEIRPPPLVLHCCTEPWEKVSRFVKRGDFLSFAGIVTFKNAEVVRETIRSCPLEHLLLETDAPFLAPIPYRGKRNEPAYLSEIMKAVAALKGISAEELDQTTTANARRFFAV